MLQVCFSTPPVFYFQENGSAKVKSVFAHSKTSTTTYYTYLFFLKNLLNNPKYIDFNESDGE